MNSAQRRQIQREFAHTASMSSDQHLRYFEYDAEVYRAAKWCQKQFGKGSFRMAKGWSRTEFKFAREKDAAYFALKWSS